MYSVRENPQKILGRMRNGNETVWEMLNKLSNYYTMLEGHILWNNDHSGKKSKG